MTNIINLVEEEIGLLADVVAELVQTIFKGISKQHMRLTNKLTEHVNKLIEAINEVHTTFKAEMYSVDPHDTLEAPLLLSLLKIEFKAQAIETWTQEFDDVVHEMGTLSLDFSKLALADVYVI